MKYNLNFSCLTKHIFFSGVAYMYVCILEHPHHFGKKKQQKKKQTNNQKDEKENASSCRHDDMLMI